MTTTIDPRARRLAENRHRVTTEATANAQGWWDLTNEQREQAVQEAAVWLRAAIEAKLIPLAERPTDKHDAIWLDDWDQPWGEYQTSPPSYGDAIVPLVWASEECSSKRDLEDQGLNFRLIGWSE